MDTAISRIVAWMTRNFARRHIGPFPTRPQVVEVWDEFGYKRVNVAYIPDSIRTAGDFLAAIGGERPAEQELFER